MSVVWKMKVLAVQLSQYIMSVLTPMLFNDLTVAAGLPTISVAALVVSVVLKLMSSCCHAGGYATPAALNGSRPAGVLSHATAALNCVWFVTGVLVWSQPQYARLAALAALLEAGSVDVAICWMVA